MDDKPLIMAIVGPSGAGKTEMASYIENKYDIHMIQSYTDRPKRHENETGHIFVSPNEMEEVMKKPMIAYTQFGDYRYCCLEEDVNDINTYVIDEDGLSMLIQNYGKQYNIHSVFIERPLTERVKAADTDRIKRDRNRFNLGYDFYDTVIFNIATLNHFYNQIDSLVQKIL